MRKLILTASLLALVAGNLRPAQAGDCGWSTAGKVLTGVAAGVAIASALDGNTRTTVTIGYPATVPGPPPAPVLYVLPNVVVAPAPVVWGPRVVYTRPAPVATAPVLVYSKYGHRHHRGWGQHH